MQKNPVMIYLYEDTTLRKLNYDVSQDVILPAFLLRDRVNCISGLFRLSIHQSINQSKNWSMAGLHEAMMGSSNTKVPTNRGQVNLALARLLLTTQSRLWR